MIEDLNLEHIQLENFSIINFSGNIIVHKSFCVT